ncbi:MAG: glycosyltransferase [Mediterranea massiliensis]|nr:glycosyltransferase [Mediterranea massiliensis]
MKDLYFLDVYEEKTNGVRTFRNEFQKALKEHSHIRLNHVVINSPQHDLEISMKENVRCISVPTINSIEHRFFVLGALLYQYIKDSPNTIFIQNSSPAFPIMKAFKKRFPQSKFIYIIHDFIWASYSMGNIDFFKQKINKEPLDSSSLIIQKAYEDNVNTFMLADRIVVLSKDSYELLIDYFGVSTQKIILIPNGLEDVNKDFDLSINRNKDICFLAVGRVTIQKGIIDLLYSFKNILLEYSNLKLIIVGEVEQEVKIMFKNEKRISFKGNIPKHLLYEYYKTCDIGIIPSYYEQCSYVGIEMKMFGLPVIASDAFGVRNMFNSHNSVTVPIGKKNEKYRKNLVNAMREFINMTIEQRKFYKQSSRDSYLSNYQLSNMRNEYIRLINNI